LTAIELERRALRARLKEAVIAVPAWAWVSVLVAVSVVIRNALAFRNPAPWILPGRARLLGPREELRRDGSFRHSREPWGRRVRDRLSGPDLPGVGALPEGAGRLRRREGDQCRGDVTRHGSGLPARPAAGRAALALAAGILTLALPGLVDTSTIMTENAFFPVFLSWVLALVLAIDKPTVVRQAAAVALTFQAYLTRTQGAVLVPALVSAIVLAVWRGALSKLANVVGIAYPPSALFVLLSFFILVLLLHYSTVISRLSDQNRILAHAARTSSKQTGGGQKERPSAGRIPR
jgi:Uncharacterized conserved protein (DUF2304)